MPRSQQMKSKGSPSHPVDGLLCLCPQSCHCWPQMLGNESIYGNWEFTSLIPKTHKKKLKGENRWNLFCNVFRHLRKASGLSDSMSTQRCSQRPRANGAVKMPQSWRRCDLWILWSNKRNSEKEESKDDFKSNSQTGLDWSWLMHSFGKGGVDMHHTVTYNHNFRGTGISNSKNSSYASSRL